ncbi:hypothetical protein ACFLSZ_07425, partial [Candidatus Bipolaricaulota bacterium]
MSRDSNECQQREASNVRPAELRPTVQVRLPDGRVFEFAREAPLVDVFRVAYDRDNQPVAAIVDGDLVESSRPVSWDIDVQPV